MRAPGSGAEIRGEISGLVRHLPWLEIKASEVHNHRTFSKHFSGKKGIKLSHGKFWPSHEKTFSKRAVNLKVE